MTADILRPCPDCGQTLIASSTFKQLPGLVARGARPWAHTWMHRNPMHDEGCYAVEDGVVDPHPAAPQPKLAEVIHVDFKNKKRLD
jgi:hypothetical protein